MPRPDPGGELHDVQSYTVTPLARATVFYETGSLTDSYAGSFGSYSLPVRNALRGYQKLAEAAPDRFLRYQYIDLLDKARERIAKLLNAPAEECVFVQNATSGR
jgi:selenocysteine lyase/cysteine desulfurase